MGVPVGGKDHTNVVGEKSRKVRWNEIKKCYKKNGGRNHGHPELPSDGGWREVRFQAPDFRNRSLGRTDVSVSGGRRTDGGKPTGWVLEGGEGARKKRANR